MKTKIIDILNYFEEIAPFSLQESYDNSGLQIGNPKDEITSVLITLDVTEKIVDEAIKKEANLIISHHPLIFKSIKTITGENFIERIIIKAIQNKISIIAVHTNIDNISEGVNKQLCKKLNLKNCKILSPISNELKKFVTFVPKEYIEQVQKAIFEAGAGHIGEYDMCSFNTKGHGTFRANNNANPFVGKKNNLHIEQEIRLETIFPKYLTHKIIEALLKAHPYEEVAYDIYPIDNQFNMVGSGMLGELEKSVSEKDFLEKLKIELDLKIIKHTKLLNKKIKKVAFCGGSGSFLLKNAIKKKADIFISADFSYHNFFDADNKLIIADIGHYESEKYTKQLFFDIITKKFSNFVVQISKINTNPIEYLI